MFEHVDNDNNNDNDNNDRTPEHVYTIRSPVSFSAQVS